MQKAFDWVDRDLLKYKLLSIGINGKIFNAIDQLYRKTVSCVKLNQFKTNWFKVNSGVRQGDSLSPNLFNTYFAPTLFIAKLKHLRNLGFTTYTKLYNCCVKPILEYSTAVWKDKKYIEHIKVYNRAK